MALVLERAAKRQPDFGGGDGQGPASRAAGGALSLTLRDVLSDRSIVE